MFIEIRYVMAKVFQLVAWTRQGQVRMIPSEVTAFMQASAETLDRLGAAVRYGTRFEVQDLLQLSSAYEKFAFQLLDLGRIADAFLQLARAADCCCRTDSGWTYNDEYGESLCRPLRGRFFAMFCQCKELLRNYPKFKPFWNKSRLDRDMDEVTEVERNIHREWKWFYREFDENWEFTKALRFGRDEVYRRRRV